MNTYDLLQQITSNSASAGTQERYLNDFAFELGWKPSYQFDLRDSAEFSSGHLVVEHGLENSAVISFLRSPVRFQDLGIYERKKLVNASYNSLIDWHIAIDAESITYLYNRYSPPDFYTRRNTFERTTVAQLSSSSFEKVASARPNANIPALDDALIRTIDFWKRAFVVEVRGISNEILSALFNSVILIRATEDHYRNERASRYSTLRDSLLAPTTPTIRELISAVMANFPVDVPESLWNPEALTPFDGLDSGTVREFVADFYKNRFAHYFDYDFSIMSKHALSRIYERYVALMRVPETNQESLFHVLAAEEKEKSFGNVYTPEFIARFFSKYLRKQMPLQRFQRMRVADPACGSGMFLRSAAEAKAESLFQEATTHNVNAVLHSVTGIDIDKNACLSSRLSLSLLGLSLTGTIPADLDIATGNALTIREDRPDLQGGLDAVIANPPFVKIDSLSIDQRELLIHTLAEFSRGKTDLYLGILKESLSLLAEGGYGCFVLPKNFLLSENAGPIRALLSQKAQVCCIVDLSSIKVFEKVGVYVILLIFRKLKQGVRSERVLAVQCSDLPGLALEDALTERTGNNPAYQIFWSEQPLPGQNAWKFPPPEKREVEERLSSLPRLSDLAEIRQGVITGADPAFIVDRSAIPTGESDIYVPLLADRDMEAYKTPKASSRYLFYPFKKGRPVEEADLKGSYPQTWEWLLSERSRLEKRKSILSRDIEWWRLSWPRSPNRILTPKIVTPHIVIAPKFSWDEAGQYAISHSPYIIPKPVADQDSFLFLLAVLNSTVCFQLITAGAHNYSRGYSRLEVATLKEAAVPAPSSLRRSLYREIVQKADERRKARSSETLDLDRALDTLINEAYGLTSSNLDIFGGMIS